MGGNWTLDVCVMRKEAKWSLPENDYNFSYAKFVLIVHKIYNFQHHQQTCIVDISRTVRQTAEIRARQITGTMRDISIHLLQSGVVCGKCFSVGIDPLSILWNCRTSLLRICAAFGDIWTVRRDAILLRRNRACDSEFLVPCLDWLAALLWQACLHLLALVARNHKLAWCCN